MNYRTHALAADPTRYVTGAAPFEHLLDDRISDGDMTTLQLHCGDPLDAPDWIPAGSTVGRDWQWRQIFTPIIHREA